MFVCVIFILLIILIVFLLFKYHFEYFKRLNVFYIKPFNFSNLFNKYCLFNFGIISRLDHWYKLSKKQNVKACGVFRILQRTLIITDPVIANQCLVKDFANFHDRCWKMNTDFEPLAANLFIMNGEKWRSLKNQLSPSFSINNVKNMLDIFKERTQELIYFLEDKSGGEIEICDIFLRLMSDIISICAFGIKTNSIHDPNDNFHLLGKQLVSNNIWHFILEELDLISSQIRFWFNLRMFDQQLEENYIQLIKDVIEFRMDNKIAINDFIEHLIKMKNNSNNKYENNRNRITECAGNGFAFLYGGFEVSSSLMTFVIYELAMNVEIQKRVQKEIDNIYENFGWLNYESLNEMHYLDMIIKETLRKYPPMAIIYRENTKPVTLDIGYNNQPVTINDRVQILIPVYSFHHDPTYFPNPELFDPDRFTPENQRKRPSHCYIPFGNGPRQCIGKSFALVQIKVSIAMILYNYTFSVCKRTPNKIKFHPMSVLLKSNSNIHLKIEQR